MEYSYNFDTFIKQFSFFKSSIIDVLFNDHLLFHVCSTRDWTSFHSIMCLRSYFNVNIESIRKIVPLHMKLEILLELHMTPLHWNCFVPEDRTSSP